MSNTRKQVEIRDLRTEDGFLTDQSMIANALNKYFAGVGEKISSDILSRLDRSEVNQTSKTLPEKSCEVELTLLPITENETMCLINSVRADCSVGPDGISSKIIKLAKKELVYPLTHLINISIATGVFPKSLKDAFIVPLHKEGDCQEPQNYRPIAILNVLSKLYERAVNIQLMRYLEDNGILVQTQYGFRPGKGTKEAVSDFAEFITSALDNQQ
jgi:hypothetical protein